MASGYVVHNAPRVLVLTQFLDRVLPQAFLDLDYTVQERPGEERPDLVVELSGPDLALLNEHRGELLLALEHLAAKTIGLEPEEHDRLSFEAGGFKAERDRQLTSAAEQARSFVVQTGKPFQFGPMNSRERRMLHLTLTATGLRTQSEGEGGQRHLVVYPPAVRAAS